MIVIWYKNYIILVFHFQKLKPYIIIKNSQKRPICFVGCSFTEGGGLKTEETFAYKISRLTNRTVYLKGISGTGFSYVYYQIANKLIPKDVEYIINFVFV